MAHFPYYWFVIAPLNSFLGVAPSTLTLVSEKHCWWLSDPTRECHGTSFYMEYQQAFCTYNQTCTLKYSPRACIKCVTRSGHDCGRCRTRNAPALIGLVRRWRCLLRTRCLQVVDFFYLFTLNTLLNQAGAASLCCVDLMSCSNIRLRHSCGFSWSGNFLAESF